MHVDICSCLMTHRIQFLYHSICWRSATELAFSCRGGLTGLPTNSDGDNTQHVFRTNFRYTLQLSCLSCLSHPIQPRPWPGCWFMHLGSKHHDAVKWRYCAIVKGHHWGWYGLIHSPTQSVYLDLTPIRYLNVNTNLLYRSYLYIYIYIIIYIHICMYIYTLYIYIYMH